ncbi:MAG: AAA family ATPase, partial [Candidatus Limnocylindria bacterium]
MSSDLVGRDRELAEVRRWLEEAGRAPSGLVILGEPGIGKTSVWEQVGREAAAGGWRLLVCRCVKSEAQLSYAALGDLLRDVLPKLLDRMAPPRRRALAAALLLEEAGGGAAPDARAVGLAFLDALRGLAEGGPLLVAIDDLHWLDPPSRDAIAFALRRLHAERIGLSATIRSSQEPVEATLGQLPFIRSLTIGPISLAATFQLVRSRLGLALSRPQLIRIHDAAGGNPLFALELAAELQRLGPAAPGAPLAIRGDLREHLGRRISRLAPATRRVLAFASASPRLSRARLRAVAGSVAVDAALLDAEAAVVVAAGSDPVRFTHPLLAAAGYAAADDRLRRQVHRRLARLSADPEEQARHLALATDAPDAAIAATLEEAASGAALRGATAASGELLEMAAARTPAGRERERRGRL